MSMMKIIVKNFQMILGRNSQLPPEINSAKMRLNLLAQVQPFLQLQPPVSQEQFQEATQVGVLKTI